MKTMLTSEQQKRADALAKMSPSEWESICKRCGICCLSKQGLIFDKESDDATVFYLNRCCDKFDTKTCSCTIYQNRLESPDCRKVDMNVILHEDILPASCGYVEYIFGPARFPAHVDFSKVKPVTDDYEKNLTIEQLRQDIIVESVTWSKRGR